MNICLPVPAGVEGLESCNRFLLSVRECKPPQASPPAQCRLLGSSRRRLPRLTRCFTISTRLSWITMASEILMEIGENRERCRFLYSRSGLENPLNEKTARTISERSFNLSIFAFQSFLMPVVPIEFDRGPLNRSELCRQVGDEEHQHDADPDDRPIHGHSGLRHH